MYEVLDIDGEILYHIEQYDYKPVNTGKLIDYIKENWVVDDEHIVRQYIEVMEIKVPDLDILDWDYIISRDDDYEHIGGGRYLNVYELESNEKELRELNLII